MGKKANGQSKNLRATNHALAATDVIGKKRESIATRRSLWKLLMRIVLIVLAVWLVISRVFGVYVVSGEDMYPRLRDGDLVIVYKLSKEYILNDVVTYTHDNGRFFGRVVALGGDSVGFTQDGMMTRNGNTLQEEVFFATNATGRAVKFPIALHEFQVFLLGDNREMAKDCRDFGALDKQTTDGSVIIVIRRRGI